MSNCLHCNAEFTPYRSTHIYCSRKCKSTANNPCHRVCRKRCDRCYEQTLIHRSKTTCPKCVNELKIEARDAEMRSRLKDMRGTSTSPRRYVDSDGDQYVLRMHHCGVQSIQITMDTLEKLGLPIEIRRGRIYIDGFGEAKKLK